jgi:hypothetical protein
MDDKDKPAAGAAWIGMLAFAAAFVGLGIWGWATGEVAWGIGSVLFGLVWGFAALRTRSKAKPDA